QARLLDVGEEGFNRVEIFGEEGIELVIVAFRTTQRAAQPHSTQRADTVRTVLRKVLLGLQAAFSGSPVEAVIRRRYFLLHCRIGHQVPGELLARELIEWLV